MMQELNQAAADHDQARGPSSGAQLGTLGSAKRSDCLHLSGKTFWPAGWLAGWWPLAAGWLLAGELADWLAGY